MRKVTFTWDPRKAFSNLRKHGVSFEDATTVFDDPLVLFLADWENGEPRFVAVGSSGDGPVLFVVNVDLEDDVVRIVSARRATKQERQRAMKKATSKKRGLEPTRASLREIPEIDFASAAVLGRGAEGLRRARALSKARRGRPKKGARPDGSSPRSIRFSDEMWRDLERRAKRRRMTLHALLREVIADWLTKAA